MQQFKKVHESSPMKCLRSFAQKSCFRHLLAIRTGLILMFRDCICHFLFITIGYPGAKQSQWHKTFTHVPKMVLEFNVSIFHHLYHCWVSTRFFFRSFVGHWPIFLSNDRNIFGLLGHNDRKLFHHGQHNIRRFVAPPANVKKQN